MYQIKRINKPWGYEAIWAETENYVGKMIFINKEHRLSKQYHKVKEETIMVKAGILRLEISHEESKKTEVLNLNTGESFHIEPGTIHRFCAPHGPVELIEVSTPHLQDVVRLEDDYNRSK